LSGQQPNLDIEQGDNVGCTFDPELDLKSDSLDPELDPELDLKLDILDSELFVLIPSCVLENNPGANTVSVKYSSCNLS